MPNGSVMTAPSVRSRARSMREQFVETAIDLVDRDQRVAVVLADISADAFKLAALAHPDRVLNVGIREQLMVSTAGGLALAGMRPIIHSYAPFAVSRAYEQLKLDLGYQGVAAVVVSIGASYDDAGSGTTHFAPEDVALIDTLPGWQVHVPAHVDQVDPLIRRAVADGGRHYVRLTDRAVERTVPWEWPSLQRTSGAVVIAVGPTLGAVREAVRGLDVTVLATTTVRPFDAEELRRAVAWAWVPDVVLVEPYLAGTSGYQVSAALAGVPHRLLTLGVERRELHRYGTAAEHDHAHGLDVEGIRRSIEKFLSAGAIHKMSDGA
jgi:transketolase